MHKRIDQAMHQNEVTKAQTFSSDTSVVGWELEHLKQDKDRHKEDNQQSKEDRDAGDAQLGFWYYSSRVS
jgi:hypothetical protein